MDPSDSAPDGPLWSGLPPASAPASRAGTTKSATTLRGEEHVRVVVRVRPLAAREANDARGLVVLDDMQTVQLMDGKTMTYDRVYGESTSQADLFEDSGVLALVNRAIAGYSATVFAFGQTGSGKTFTMTGPDAATPTGAGVIPRALRHLFELIALAPPEIKYTVRAGYLEIYNEQVQDLLNPSGAALPVRWRRERGFYVENLFVVECEVLDDCLAVLEEGLRNRTTAAHALNERSSRSHSVLTVYIESEEAAGAEGGEGPPTQRFGKISFVDLAGSERVKESKATGEMLKESSNINQSLLVLGSCISALADPKKKNGHIPYRDSKLTKLLMDSLGGNGIALMIACVSPAQPALPESIQTLRYAARAKRIRNRPTVRLDPREELIARLKQEVQALRQENAQLKAARFPGAVVPPPPGSRRGSIPAPMPPAAVKAVASAPAGPSENEFRQMQDMAQSYAMQVDLLRQDNMQLAQAKVRTDHMYATLMRENELLRDQLDRARTAGYAPVPMSIGTSFAPQAGMYQGMAPPQQQGMMMGGGPVPQMTQPPQQRMVPIPARAPVAATIPRAAAPANGIATARSPPPPQGQGQGSPPPGMHQGPGGWGGGGYPPPAAPWMGAGAPQMASSPPPGAGKASLALGGVPDLHRLRAEVSELDAEIARYSAGAGK
ncbi:Kinesin- protein 12 [Allomyces javanicus]|nr:Kinesin- protein 12 [Allomyces javanicus]